MTPARIAVIALVVLALGASAAHAFPGYTPPGQRLEMAKEEHGDPAAPPRRHDLPAGELTVTPTQLIAANAGQHVRFTVTLDRAVPGATLHVRLPRRWLEVPASRVPAIRAPRLHANAGGRARLRRAGRDVALTLDGAADGATASFDVVDNGIPAGTYELPFRWVDDSTGRTQRAGTAQVRFLAPSRETLTTVLSAPGIGRNASNDTIEESESFIAVVPGNKDRLAATINWANSSFPAWITNDGGVTWTGPLSMPQTLDIPGSSSPESASICCDPTATADPLGNVWVGGLSFQGQKVPARAVVNRIAAGTNSFRTQTTGLPTGGVSNADKPMMTIDNSPDSPTFGRLYMVWNQLPSNGSVNVVISQCDTRPGGVPNAAACDNADNWTTPAVVAATGSYIYADVAVGPGGRVYVTWWDYSNTNAIRGDVCDPSSQNCASSAGWSAAPGAQNAAVLDSTGGVPVPFMCPILAQPGGRDGPAPNVDVDRSSGANDGRVYVTWNDLRPGSGTTRCKDASAQKGGTPQLTHLTWDAFVASAAGGALPGGSSPSASVGTRLLTDGEGGGQANSDDWFAWLSVDQTTGQAWADFYSTRDDATRKTTNFYARSVTPNGGTHTLGPLTKVSSGASNYSATPCCSFANDYGDYTGSDATSGVAYPVWSDNSSGTKDGEAFTFARSQASGGLPTPATGAASAIQSDAATLNGTVNPHGQATSYSFEWGTTTAYGQQTVDQSAGSATTPQAAPAGLSGLSPATTYHYRLLATNASGTTAGEDRSFKTTAGVQRQLTVSTTGSGTVTSNPSGINCGADCDQLYDDGTVVTLTASPATGWTFTGWGGACTGTGTCKVTMDAAKNVSATFTQQSFTLTVTRSGSGTVTSSPSGIDCGADCSQSYLSGTPVTLSAKADAGWRFAGWSGEGCSGTGTCKVTMTQASNVTATFVQQFQLSVSKDGTGSGTVTSSPGGISCGADCSEPYDTGTSVTLTASPAAGSSFTGWSDSNCPGTAACVVKVDAAKSVTATFTQNPPTTFALTLTRDGSGTVTSSPAGIDCGNDCSEVYTAGTDVTLSAEPASGWRFAGWSGEGCTGTGTCQVTMDAARKVTATFVAQHQLSVTTAGSGTVASSPAGIDCGATCSALYDEGTAVTLTPTPAAGWSFAGWGGDCAGAGGCAMTMDAARSVSATFTENPTGGGGEPADTGTPAPIALPPLTPPTLLPPVAPSFTLSLAHLRPADAARRGLPLAARCAAGCRLLAQAYLDGGTLRRLGLARGSRTLMVGSGSGVRTTAGTVRLTVRLSVRVRRALRRATRVTFVLRLRGLDSSGRAARTRYFRLGLRRTGRSPLVVALRAAPAGVP